MMPGQADLVISEEQDIMKQVSRKQSQETSGLNKEHIYMQAYMHTHIHKYTDRNLLKDRIIPVLSAFYCSHK